MTEGIETSANESLVWQLAYESNDCYDALQEARAKQTRYEELGAIGLEGVTVTIDDEVIASVADQAQAAEREFALVSGMVGAVATMEDSPLAIGRPEKPTASKPASQKTPRSSRGRSPEKLAKTELGQDKVVMALLSRDGSMKAEDDVSAGILLREQLGLSSPDWSNTRVKMENNGLLIVVRGSEKPRFIEELKLDLKVLATKAQEGELRPAVRKAFEEFEARDGQPDNNGEGRRFLASRGGQEQVASTWLAEEPMAPETTDQIDVDEEGVEDLEIYTTGASNGLHDDLKAIHTQHHSPRPKRPRSTGRDKMFTIGFEAEGKHLRRSIKVHELMKFSPTVRMLIGYGQVNMSTFDFYKTDEERRSYVLRIINKGLDNEADLIDETDLDTLVAEAINDGYLRQNGKGPELTGEGVDFLRNTKYGRAKLGQKPFPARRRPPARQVKKAATPISETALSRAVAVA